jgi:cell pole-organizing protein PopZ
MSKPEGTGAQNLEEILASIRKSVSEESSASRDGVRPAGVAPGLGAQPGASPQPGEGLSRRLAGALGATATPGEDALAGLFAHVPGKDSPAPKAGPVKPNGSAEAKDPFWFLSRGTPTTGKELGTDTGARSGTAEGTKSPEPDIKLSRPETLRPSLPPLYTAPGEAADATRASSDGNGAGAAAKAARVEPAPAGGAKGSSPSAGGQDGAGAAGSVAAQPSKAATPSSLPTQGPGPAATAQALPKRGASPVTGQAPATAPQAPVMTALTPAATTQAPAATAQAPAATTQAERPPPAEPSGAALEEMIAQLLEPVLVRWLDENLPRMIEQVVRQEVSRALAASRPTEKA